MNTFLERLSRYSHWVTFLLLEVLSGVLLFRFNAYQDNVMLTQANTVAGRMLDWKARGMAFLNLMENNSALTQENILLQQENLKLRQEISLLTHDTTYTERKQAELLEHMQLLPSRVISNSVQLRDNYMTIDRGSLDGVKPEMGVVSGTGIVGITYMVSEHYSIVLPILNSKSSISCRLRGSEYFGYLKWRGGNTLQAFIDDIPRHAKFKVGDIIETSGFSSVFPPGIFVGKVAQIHDSDDGLSYQLEVQLSTDLANTRDVAVVIQEQREEIGTLEKEVKK